MRNHPLGTPEMTFQNIRISKFSGREYRQNPLAARAFGGSVIRRPLKNYPDFAYLKDWTVRMSNGCFLRAKIYRKCVK